MKNKKNITLLLFGALVILCILQVIFSNKAEEAFLPVPEGTTETVKEAYEETKEPVEPAIEEDDGTDPYELTGYIYNNSKKYMERLKTEVNNLANDKSDTEHLYDVAESIRLNQISYYTMLNDAYDDEDDELIEKCKAYAFNVEALAYNIMRYVKTKQIGYISRVMICISSDSGAAWNFQKAQQNYNTAMEHKAEALAPKATETTESA